LAEWIEALCDMVLKWKPVIGWLRRQFRSRIGPFLERRLRERSGWIARKQFPTGG
jgi:hypothetical protein